MKQYSPFLLKKPYSISMQSDHLLQICLKRSYKIYNQFPLFLTLQKQKNNEKMKKGITKFPHSKLIISNHKPLFVGFSLNKQNQRKSFQIKAHVCQQHSRKKNSFIQKKQNGQASPQQSYVSGRQLIFCQNNNNRFEKRSNSQHGYAKIGMKSKNAHFRVSQIMKKGQQRFHQTINFSENLQFNRYSLLFDKICKNLKKQFILQQNHIKSYTIKIDHLKSLLEYIFTYQYDKSKSNSGQINLCKQSIFACINSELEQLYFYKNQKDLEEKKKLLCLSKSIDLYKFTENKFKDERDELNLSLMELFQQYQKTKSKIEGLTELIQLYKCEVRINQSSILQQIKIKTNLQQQIKLKRGETAFLQTQIEESNKLLTTMREKGNSLKQFVSEQNNKLVLFASEDYKRIQQQIYQYASYLQSNQLASDLSYQPFPFQAIEDNIMENMRQINKTIKINVKQITSKNSHISTQQKNRMMRDFILNTIDKFKKKVKIQLDRTHSSVNSWTLRPNVFVNLLPKCKNDWIIGHQNNSIWLIFGTSLPLIIRLIKQLSMKRLMQQLSTMIHRRSIKFCKSWWRFIIELN